MAMDAVLTRLDRSAALLRMATRIELSVGSTTGVPSLAEQIKRYKQRLFHCKETDTRVFERSAKVKQQFHIVIVQSRETCAGMEGDPKHILSRRMNTTPCKSNTRLWYARGTLLVLLDPFFAHKVQHICRSKPRSKNVFELVTSYGNKRWCHLQAGQV